MIEIRTAKEIELIRSSNILVSETLAEVAKWIKPGVTTDKLDSIAEEYILSHGGVPGFLGYQGYPKTLCTSVNSQVVHGIPNSYILKEGDIISVDCGAIKDGFYGDSAYTFAVGKIDEEKRKLMEITKGALYKGIEMAVEGNRTGDIGFAIQEFCETNGFSVVRELVGHGLGRKLHEPPEVPNYGRRGKGVKLKAGMVICIEPMINLGRKEIVQEADGWTIRTADRKPSAHFEHAIAIQKGEAEILSSFKIIEEIERNN
jgi:methionyl aminopeptidase